ncbi:MAG: bifunctional alpha,alpha-trehalose-phosphate synthase (UDP-forming)/trehalose-phosphatase, partial [Candidatus Dadabacteria bacterium]|nr:bifunctional alpha,alpha-trehalose-phosphate synthase (UDP-forming)/trehalose-phosphatase [Candidatus Dadabacteria bacterium]
MKKLIIVSNRLPTTVREQGGKLFFDPSVGGVATGLSSLGTDYEKCWIGWPGVDYGALSGQQVAEIEKRLGQESFYPVGLSAEEVKDYYQGFCNEVIWPIFHYFVQYGTYKKDFWESYIKVNTKFANAILDVASEGDYIWVHDYQLMLVPGLVKKQLPKSSIGFFLHIPFPSSEIFRLIPWCREIIQGITGADLIGFHTFDYVRHFAESVRRILGHEHSLGRFIIGEREIRTDTFPMGIDYEKFSTAPQNRSIKKRKDEFRDLLGTDRKIILSIDRLDYSKGIPERLRAFDLFLEKNPKIRGKVVLLLIAVPSRTEVVHYKILKNEVDNMVGAINGRYGTIGWNPIHYMYRSFGFEDLISLYLAADILFITPLRDGMNLIAKEYVAARQNKAGVLILGEMAGTAQELSEAIIINPNDLESTSQALETAFAMSVAEQKRRMKTMQRRLARYDIKTWTADFMGRLDETKERQLKMFARRLSPEMVSKLIEKYKASRSCLFLLDYDGSLVSFKNNPQDAGPDPEIYSALGELSSRGKNELVVIRGGDRK